MVMWKKGKNADSDNYRVIVLPDIHAPYHDKKTLRAVENFMADYRWDEYVNLGDLMDFDSISRFNAGLLRKLETRRIAKDYEIGNEILDRHQSILRSNNPDAKFTLLEGNHEFRIEYLIDKDPNLEGIIDVSKNLNLDERGFKWVRSWSKGELHRVGKLYFHHGLYINKYHAAKMADSFGVNIVYGHTHDVQSYSRNIRGKNKVIKATSLGYLGDENKLEYMRNRPNNWCQAIGVVEVRPDGTYNLAVIEIINHTFSYAGKTYKP